MSGWLTNGLTVQTPATYQGASTPQIPVDTQLPGGQSPETVAVPTGAIGLGAFASLTATGSTQGGAAAITAFKNVITVSTTASTHGVILPTAATGLTITIGNSGTFGVKVYPAKGGQIAAVATNGADATVLAINKVNTYMAVNATRWIVYRGA